MPWSEERRSGCGGPRCRFARQRIRARAVLPARAARGTACRARFAITGIGGCTHSAVLLLLELPSLMSRFGGSVE